MASADLYAWLIEATLATSAAMLAVLALRKLLRAAFGSGACHAAWSAVPVALLATLLPVAEADAPVAPLAVIRVPIEQLVVEAPRSATPDLAAWVCIAWLCGCVAFAMFLVWQQRRFMRGLGRIVDRGDGLLLADSVAGLPAVIGVWKPRIVMPADAMDRYDSTERGLMLAHEREHIARGDLLANACVAALRCLFWFNPLLHAAARRFRDDQELACDAGVIARHPHSRRSYGEAMLKTQIAATVLPLGCHWGQSHPLKERIEMLKRPLPSSLRHTGGRAIVIALLLGAGYAAWAVQPTASPTAKPASQQGAVTMSGNQMGMRDVIANLAREHGMTVSGLELVPEVRKISFRLEGVPMETVLELVGDEAGLDARVNGKTIEFSRKPAGAAVEVLRAPPPAYPADLAKQGITGRVMLIVAVAADGSVSAVKVDRSAGDERLDAAALEAAKQWKFKPLVKDGRPVPSQVRVPIDFELHGGRDEPAQDAHAALARQAGGRLPNTPDWSNYDRMVHSLSASWEKPAAPADEC